MKSIWWVTRIFGYFSDTNRSENRRLEGRREKIYYDQKSDGNDSHSRWTQNYATRMNIHNDGNVAFDVSDNTSTALVQNRKTLKEYGSDTLDRSRFTARVIVWNIQNY